MAKICLIKCPSPFLIDEKVFPPLGLMAIGTYLRSKGHDVIIDDDGNIPGGFDWYGFGPTTSEYGYALYIKEMLGDERTFIGGPHVNVTDCSGDKWDAILPGQLTNPVIDRSLVDIKSYKYFIDGRLATTIVTSHGCPYKCAFCCKTNHSVKFVDVNYVLTEISYLYDQGYRALMFFDDLFILKKKRAETIFRHLKELGIISRCFVRADTILKHGFSFVKMMSDCGVVEVGMGIESGSDTILKNINKGESAQDMKTAIRLLKRMGIRVKGFFIIGLPGESEVTIDETRRFLDEIELDDMDATIFQPYPGSPIFKNPEHFDIKWDDDMDFQDMFYKGRPGEYHSNVWTSSLTSDQITQHRDELEGEYK
jgi:uncharacterized radical SAM superfamily protein